MRASRNSFAGTVPFVHEELDTKSLHFDMAELQSRMRLGEPDALDLDYTRTMMAFLLFDERPARIAMIGLGGGSLAKFCHRHLPRARVEVVEIDPRVIALRDQFRVPKDDRRLRVIAADGARFVRQTPGRFDVLLVDGFDGQGQPARLCSQRFYDDCLDALAPNGLLVVNLHSSDEVYAERIRCSFGDVLAVPAEDGQNCIVFAGAAPRRLRAPRGGVRRPKGLDPRTWEPLQAAFARVANALRASGGG